MCLYYILVQVHPIVSIAAADLCLAVLWIVGGAMWLRGIGDRQWCFAVSLFTVVSSEVCVCFSVSLNQCD